MKHVFIIALSLVLFTGCFQYEEEMILKKDGSGEVTLKFVFGKFISSMMDLDEDHNKEHIRFRLRNDKGLELLDESSYERNGRRVYEVTVKFDHYKYLRHLDVRSDNYDDDIDMDVRDFFEDISYDGKTFERYIDLGNKDNDDEDVPNFVKKMVDIEFHFSVKLEDKKTKDWSFDLDDLSRRSDLVMKIN